jgi:hypothetical protein
LEHLSNIKAPLITPLQLLRFNTQEQHPFADRLIEYLLENAITNHDEEISENVLRVQKIITENSHIHDFIPEVNGFWSEEMNKILYEYMTTHVKTFEENHDILGYVDKDVEKNYASVKYYTNSKKVTTILNSDLNEEDK